MAAPSVFCHVWLLLGGAIGVCVLILTSFRGSLQVAMLESNLNQEQMMHMVTKTQLASVDEDNRRLRQQLQAARKRSLLALDSR